MDSIREAIRLFQQGGLVMYPLLLCSIYVVAIVLERWRYYRRSNRQSPGFFLHMQEKISNADWAGASKICEQSPGVVARVLAAGLRCRGDIAGMKEAFENVTAWESAQLRKQLGQLDTVVTLAPLLGLLGTVAGMIGSFSVFNVNNSTPAAITGGVGEALVATATGLIVAVLALVSHSYFCHRLDALITEIEKSCAFIIENVKGEQV